jgi:hypothetical protein
MAASPSLAQTDVLTVDKVPKLTAKRGETLPVALQVRLQAGYHVNSNTSSEDYLIPLRLTWDSKPLEAAPPVFPAPHLEKYQFSAKPLSVFTGDFAIRTPLHVPANAPSGLGLAKVKLRYQACSQTLCLQPKSLEIQVPYEIR